jgi:hypothetical protein
VPTTQSLSNRSPARSKSASVQSSTSIPTFRRLPPHNWTLNPVDGDIGNHAFVERDFLDLAWHRGFWASAALRGPKVECWIL